MNANSIHEPALALAAGDIVARQRKIANARCRWSPNRDADVEDRSQDATLNVLTAIRRGDYIKDVMGILSTVTRNKCIDEQRATARRLRHEAWSLDAPDAPSWHLADDRLSPEAQLIAAELKANVQALLWRLRVHHPRQARIVEAVVLEGYRVAEVARMENIKPSEVSTLKLRGLDFLRKLVSRHVGASRAGPSQKSASSHPAGDRTDGQQRPQIVDLFKRWTIPIGIAA